MHHVQEGLGAVDGMEQGMGRGGSEGSQTCRGPRVQNALQVKCITTSAWWRRCAFKWQQQGEVEGDGDSDGH
jgi:hypothetical protein